MLASTDIVRKRCRADVRLFLTALEEDQGCMCCLFHLAMLVKALLTLWHSMRRTGTRGQLGRAVKAIDSKSIGVTRVSSSLTAVDAICLRHLISLDSIGAASKGGVIVRIDYGRPVAD